VGCVPNAGVDCCSQFVAEVISCCKDVAGFSLTTYLAAFQNLTCQVVPDGESIHGEQAGKYLDHDAENGELDEASEHRGRCTFMDLDLECPTHTDGSFTGTEAPFTGTEAPFTGTEAPLTGTEASLTANQELLFPRTAELALGQMTDNRTESTTAEA